MYVGCRCQYNAMLSAYVVSISCFLIFDLQTIDISDEAEVVQSKEAWSRSSNSRSHDVMYDPQLLKSVPSADDVTSKFSTFECRPLQSNDYKHGFISLLKQLTSVGSVSESDFQDRFNLMKNCKGTYHNTVIVDKSKSDQIIASATLIVEKKFIHSCANVSVIMCDPSMRVLQEAPCIEAS